MGPCPAYSVRLKEVFNVIKKHNYPRPQPALNQKNTICKPFRIITSAHLDGSHDVQDNGATSATTLVEKIERDDYGKFVRFLHLASPYVAGHRGKLMVLAIPGEVAIRPDRLYPLLEDVLLLHGLGTRLVIVVGAKERIDEYQRREGQEPQWVGAYRITDNIAIKAAIEAAGTIATEVSARLSRAPSIPMVRRHARGDGQMHFGPAVQVVTGNFVTAKRRGIVNGVDFGFMGQVRFVQTDAIHRQLDAGNIVLLSNIGISASGELLNCNIFDVSTHAAVELKADKLLCLTGADVRPLNLPQYLPIDDAEDLIASSISADGEEPVFLKTSIQLTGGAKGSPINSNGNGNGSSSNNNHNGNNRNGNGMSSSSGLRQSPVEMMLDMDSWQQIGFPPAVLAAVVACKNGVNRAHLIDIERDGAMLLELYTRDGINGVCMIAADLYEGIRKAEPQDCSAVAELLSWLQEAGLGVPFPPQSASEHLSNLTVIDREGKLLGCAVTTPLGTALDGKKVTEIGAFVINPAYRRQGFGDSLLDYVEQDIRRKGADRIVILAGQGSYEWFTQRGFETVGDAATSELLPESRKRSVPSVCKLLTKRVLEVDSSLDAPAGKRIGF